jgi:hypothetical protein
MVKLRSVTTKCEGCAGDIIRCPRHEPSDEPYGTVPCYECQRLVAAHQTCSCPGSPGNGPRATVVCPNCGTQQSDTTAAQAGHHRTNRIWYCWWCGCEFRIRTESVPAYITLQVVAADEDPNV